jgi:hypothetical protein
MKIDRENQVISVAATRVTWSAILAVTLDYVKRMCDDREKFSAGKWEQEDRQGGFPISPHLVEENEEQIVQFRQKILPLLKEASDFKTFPELEEFYKEVTDLTGYVVSEYFEDLMKVVVRPVSKEE